MPSLTSTTLLQGLEDPRNGRAWRRFYARYTPMLLSFAKRVGLSDADAQDVVAETLTTFIAAYRAGQYRRERGRLKSWLGGIAQNKIHKHHARRVHASLAGDALGRSGRPAEPVAPDALREAYEREWALERLNLALENLRRESDPNTYQAFDLYALKDWPVAKVAAFLKTTPNAIYISKSRMLKRLRIIMQQIIDDEEQG